MFLIFSLWNCQTRVKPKFRAPFPSWLGVFTFCFFVFFFETFQFRSAQGPGGAEIGRVLVRFGCVRVFDFDMGRCVPLEALLRFLCESNSHCSSAGNSTVIGWSHLSSEPERVDGTILAGGRAEEINDAGGGGGAVDPQAENWKRNNSRRCLRSRSSSSTRPSVTNKLSFVLLASAISPFPLPAIFRKLFDCSSSRSIWSGLMVDGDQHRIISFGTCFRFGFQKRFWFVCETPWFLLF